MDEAVPPAKRSRAGSIVGIVVAGVFLALGLAAFFFGGGPIIGIIALAGGVLTLAASVFTLARP
jgi:hypothetical protein